MSATLGVLLKALQPDWNIKVYERLDRIAAESSDAWNNAGTGHSALCELNYTPEKEDGSIDISKAIKILEQFEVSKQFWAYLVQKQWMKATDFIHSVPHMSFVSGEDDTEYLRKRFNALQNCHLFHTMEFSENIDELRKWIPLMMKDRTSNDKIAATKIDTGTDVNFGDLTRNLFQNLEKNHEVKIHLNHEVNDLEQNEDKSWNVKVKNEDTDEDFVVKAAFVFIGAGGGALRLLDKSDIEEGKGFAGFPVTGQWLICKNETVIEQHNAKVYGKAKIGAPPMSVPHLDTRIIDGKNELLFGPFAGFSTKFLKEGSYLDLPRSIDADNLIPMIGAGLHNLSLTKYLIEQVLQSFDDKMNDLREFVPGAKNEDWELAIAGQRVQVIKKDEKDGGILEFGTEIVTSKDGTVAALLGASPGASTAVPVMLEILKKCFADKMLSEEWNEKIQEIIPTYGKKLVEDELLAIKTKARTHAILDLDI